MNVIVEAPDPKQLVMDNGSGAYRVPWQTVEHSFRESGVEQPSFAALCAQVVKYGADGVLEAALHLDDADFTKLTELCKSAPQYRKGAKS